jgi:hypothetical protein
MHTLFLISGAEPTRIAATIGLADDGRVTIETERPSLRPLLEHIFLRDFDETIGLPARRLRAKQGSIEAFRAAAAHLGTSLGFRVVLQAIKSEPTTLPAPRITKEQSYSVYAALLLTAKNERVLENLRGAAALVRDVENEQARQMSQYGCGAEFSRQKNALRRRRAAGGSKAADSRVSIGAAETAFYNATPAMTASNGDDDESSRLIGDTVVAAAALKAMVQRGAMGAY